MLSFRFLRLTRNSGTISVTRKGCCFGPVIDFTMSRAWRSTVTASSMHLRCTFLAPIDPGNDELSNDARKSTADVNCPTISVAFLSGR